MKTYHHVTVGKTNGGRVATIPFGENIKARIAYPKGSRPGKKRAKRGKGKGHVISLLFSPAVFSMAEAKAWARKHGHSVKGSAKAGTTAKRVPKRNEKAIKKGGIKRRKHLCKVCRKPIHQTGAGRPRLRHERCKG